MKQQETCLEHSTTCGRSIIVRLIARTPIRSGTGQAEMEDRHLHVKPPDLKLDPQRPFAADSPWVLKERATRAFRPGACHPGTAWVRSKGAFPSCVGMARSMAGQRSG